MNWCSVESSKCPTLAALAAGKIHDNGAFEFEYVSFEKAAEDGVCPKNCTQPSEGTSDGLS